MPATRITRSALENASSNPEATLVYAVEWTLRQAWQDAPLGSTMARELEILLRHKDVRGIREAFRAAMRHPTFEGAAVKMHMGRNPQYSWSLQTWHFGEDQEIVRSHEIVLGKYGRTTYTLLHELAHTACSHALTDSATVLGENEGHGATWRVMLCHLLAWSGFPNVAALLAQRFNDAGLPTSGAWELSTIVLRNVDVWEHSVLPMRPQTSVHVPAWAWGDPPRCAVCGTEHHACDCAALEARERVKCKRAIRLWLMETKGLTSEQACAIIGTGGAA